MAKPAPGAQSGGEAPSAMWRASGLGMELVGSILGATLIGWLVDQGFNTAPKGVVIGLIIGVVGGGLNFVRTAMKMNKRALAEYQRRRAGGGRAAPGAPGPSGAEPGGGGSGRGDARQMFESKPGDPQEPMDVDFPDDFEKW